MQESHAVLVVEFTGPSVSDGTLCTDRLAPSLLALSDALRFLNRLVNPDGVEAGLSVTKAEGGRFELGLWVWRTFENQIACLADGGPLPRRPSRRLSRRDPCPQEVARGRHGRRLCVQSRDRGF